MPCFNKIFFTMNTPFFLSLNPLITNKYRNISFLFRKKYTSFFLNFQHLQNPAEINTYSQHILPVFSLQNSGLGARKRGQSPITNYQALIMFRSFSPHIDKFNGSFNEPVHPFFAHLGSRIIRITGSHYPVVSQFSGACPLTDSFR